MAILDPVHFRLRDLFGIDHLAGGLLVDDQAELFVLQVALSAVANDVNPKLRSS